MLEIKISIFSSILVCFLIPLFSPFSEVNHQAKVSLIFSAIEIERHALDVPYFGTLFFCSLNLFRMSPN